VATATAPDRIYFTGDDEANRLLATDPLALLIGFALDQQVPVQKAFSSPYELQKRIGTLDARRIAELDPDELDRVFREKPALHRFPGAMAARVQELCATIVDDYDGHAERLWTEAADGADLRRRIGALPGFGDMKVRGLGSVLALRFGVEAAQDLVPGHACLGAVDSPEALEEYQAKKREWKASMKAQQG
jgi:uncharacterized HhH-GPD family protein